MSRLIIPMLTTAARQWPGRGLQVAGVAAPAHGSGLVRTRGLSARAAGLCGLRTFAAQSQAKSYVVDPSAGKAQVILPEDAADNPTSLLHPHRWFRQARRHPRRIIAHFGPTNSGKTYRALKRLSEARAGVFCGPLRLLAWEVFERLNASGTVCSLVTGQELETRDNATVVSCTTEMVDVSRRYDVCVIDEIQLLGDQDRGWAWTRALLGVPAREVHVCGEPAAESVLRRLCELTGDILEVHHYERMSELKISDSPISSLAEVRPGDAVIGFSRRELFALKREIEASTGLKACVVYGSLPPEVRRHQARLFNQGAEGGWPVIVATDAIGMGLNLNIGRVIFSKLEKYDGNTTRPLKPPEVKQIGGRAGRFGSEFPVGMVTCLSTGNVGNQKNMVSMSSLMTEEKRMNLRPGFWLCGKCEAPNRPKNKKCFSCSAKRGMKANKEKATKEARFRLAREIVRMRQPGMFSELGGASGDDRNNEKKMSDTVNRLMKEYDNDLEADVHTDFISKMFEISNPPIQTVGLAPTQEHMEAFAKRNSVLHLLLPESVASWCTSNTSNIAKESGGAIATVIKPTSEWSDFLKQKADHPHLLWVSLSGSLEQVQGAVDTLRHKKRILDEETHYVGISTRRLLNSVDFFEKISDPETRLGETYLRLRDSAIQGAVKNLAKLEGFKCSAIKASDKYMEGFQNTSVIRLRGRPENIQDSIDVIIRHLLRESSPWDVSEEPSKDMLVGDSEVGSDFSRGSVLGVVRNGGGNDFNELTSHSKSFSLAQKMDENDVLEVPLSHLLIRFQESAVFDSDLYHMTDICDMISLAQRLDHLTMPLEVRMSICRAPVSTNNEQLVAEFVKMCARLVDQDGQTGGVVRLSPNFVPKELPTSSEKLNEMEQSFKIVQAYLWLARRFPLQCPDLELGENTALALQEMMEDGLVSLSEQELLQTKKYKAKMRGKEKRTQSRQKRGKSGKQRHRNQGQAVSSNKKYSDSRKLKSSGRGKGKNMGETKPQKKGANAKNRKKPTSRGRMGGRTANTEFEAAEKRTSHLSSSKQGDVQTKPKGSGGIFDQIKSMFS